MAKTACITGISGQTGSYLAELLLDQGYKVYGLKRRSSSFNTERIDHLYQDSHVSNKLELMYGDLSDASSIAAFIGETKPDLFFNMGAMSHVRVSFDIPDYTMDVTGTGVLRCLEAIRKISPKTRFLQASSSEMFGATPPPQNESTPFHPRSPYAVAKVAGYYMTINYREAYGMHAVNAISFNKECIASNTPLMIKKNGHLDIVRPKDLIPIRKKGPNKQVFELNNIEVWDGNIWTKIKSITATKRNKNNKEHDILNIQTRAGVIDVTSHHSMLNSQTEEIEASKCLIGNHLLIADNMPLVNGWTVVSNEMAELLGLLTADGFVSEDTNKIQFTNNDIGLQMKIRKLWSKLFLGTAHLSTSPSGFGEKNTFQLRLNNCPELVKWLRNQLYTEDGFKKIPQIILNAPVDIQTSYLNGYYAGDGLKKGSGESFGTNSSVLALGLCWIYFLQGKKCTIYQENNLHHSTGPFFRINILTNSKIGMHLRKNPNEIRKIDIHREIEHWTNDWVFDLETESQVFMAGVGRLIVHNSPRRGETFVTRKITRAATRIKLGLQDKLYLGNLNAKRDWHHAKDAARAMIMILESDVPDDYCISAGEMHSVQDFAELVFKKLDLDWNEYVSIDSRYFRPTEVDALCGDSTKLREKIGWAPLYSFEQLVDEMIAEDMKLALKEQLLLGK